MLATGQFVLGNSVEAFESDLAKCCGARFAVVGDQEQVDKIESCAERIPALKTVIYDEPRGLGDYDMEGLHSFADVQAAGRALLAAEPELAERWRAGIICELLPIQSWCRRPKTRMKTSNA